MAVPSAKILDFKEIPALVGGPAQNVMGIFLKVMGQISGRFLLLIPEKTSINLLHSLIPGCEIDSPLNMGEMETSCMREVGNILAGAFLNALSVITQTPMLNSLPSMSFDLSGSLINHVVADMVAVSDKVLMIETSFIEEAEDLKIHIFLLPDPESLQKMLKSIGVA
jgi:chemotaxis protein CheC